MIKTCRICSNPKDETAFYLRENGRRRSECVECCCRLARESLTPEGREARLVRMKARNEKHRLGDAERRHKYIAEKRAYVEAYKAGKLCVDCERRYPPFVMDFDHLPDFEKRDTIARMTNGTWTLESLKAEIEKCELVCSNCHRIRSHSRGWVTDPFRERKAG